MIVHRLEFLAGDVGGEVRPGGHVGQPVLAVPPVFPASVAGQVAIGVVGEGFRGF